MPQRGVEGSCRGTLLNVQHAPQLVTIKKTPNAAGLEICKQMPRQNGNCLR